MSVSAFVTMITVQLTVTVITAYFFYKVLNAPKKAEDSEEEA